MGTQSRKNPAAAATGLGRTYRQAGGLSPGGDGECPPRETGRGWHVMMIMKMSGPRDRMVVMIIISAARERMVMPTRVGTPSRR